MMDESEARSIGNNVDCVQMSVVELYDTLFACIWFKNTKNPNNVTLIFNRTSMYYCQNRWAPVQYDGSLLRGVDFLQ